MESFHFDVSRRHLVLSDWRWGEIRRFAIPKEFAPLLGDVPGEYAGGGEGEFFLLHEQGMRLAIACAAMAGARVRIRARCVWDAAFGMASEEVLYWFTKCYYGSEVRQKAYRKALKLIFDANEGGGL